MSCISDVQEHWWLWHTNVSGIYRAIRRPSESVVSEQEWNPVPWWWILPAMLQEQQACTHTTSSLTVQQLWSEVRRYRGLGYQDQHLVCLLYLLLVITSESHNVLYCRRHIHMSYRPVLDNRQDVGVLVLALCSSRFVQTSRYRYADNITRIWWV